MKKKENTNIPKSLYPQGMLTCSVCSKEFKANDDTRYIINGGYTCSWKCFCTESKKKREEMKASDNSKKKVKT